MNAWDRRYTNRSQSNGVLLLIRVPSIPAFFSHQGKERSKELNAFIEIVVAAGPHGELDQQKPLAVCDVMAGCCEKNVTVMIDTVSVRKS